MHLKRSSLLAMPLAAGAALLSLYLLTMPRGLSWDLGGADSGELAVAAFTRGLAHSPGSPAYLLLAQPFTLLPLRSPAVALAIYSALGITGAAVMVSAALLRLPGLRENTGWPMPLAACLAALVFGLSEQAWTQALIVEVYGAAAFFCAAMLPVILSLSAQQDSRAFARRLFLLGLLLGLGLGVHLMVLLLALFGLVTLLLTNRTQLLRPDSLAGLGGLALGLLVFAYLPLRAGASPLSNWGNPDTFERFWWVISSAAYSGRFNLSLAARRLPALVGVILRGFGAGGLALALLGLSLWWDTRRELLAAFAVMLVANMILVAGYDSADTLPYLYPSLMLLAIAAGEAALYILASILDHRQARLQAPVAVLLMLAALLPPLIRGWNIAQSATTEADTWGQAVVEAAPAGSVILSNDTARGFAVRYAAALSVGREDVIPVEAGLLQYDWYRQDLARFLPQPGLDDAGAAGGPASDAELIARLPQDIPVLFTYMPALPAQYRVDATDTEDVFVLVRP
jgi:hypothetical protein